MSFPFAWNEFADQPHNVAPRRQRFWHHFRHAGSYFKLVSSNLAIAIPALRRYHHYRRSMHFQPVDLSNPFGLFPAPEQD